MASVLCVVRQPLTFRDVRGWLPQTMATEALAPELSLRPHSTIHGATWQASLSPSFLICEKEIMAVTAPQRHYEDYLK